MSKLFTKDRRGGFTAFRSTAPGNAGPRGSSFQQGQGFKNLAPRLTPNTPTVDIINSFPWTLTPQTSLALQETPYIKLTEYYLEESFINQSFQAYGIRISSINDFFKVDENFLKIISSGRISKTEKRKQHIFWWPETLKGQ